jgi:hypothetical protein
MSLMAGFDMLIEVSKQTALDLIKANINLGGTPPVPASPPFELSIPISIAGITGLAHTIVNGMALDLTGDNGVTLTLNFANSSIILDPPASITASLLDGDIVVQTSLELVDGSSPNTKALSTNLSAATVAVAFSAAAQQRISTALAGTPVTVAQFNSVAQNTIQGFLRGIGRQTIQNPQFLVVQGQTGSISRGQFDRLEVNNIANQAIGLFGMLIPTKPIGDHTQKTSSAITAGHGVCLDVGADAFHRLIFCPNLAGANPVSSLPPSCGSGTLDANGVTVTNITDTFADGQINIDGALEKSGFCYDAHGTFHGAVTLSVSGSKLTASLALDDPHIQVDVPWYCTLVEILAGPVGIAIAGVLKGNMDDAMQQLQSGASNVSGTSFGSFGTGNVSGASFDEVTVTPEGLTLNGKVSIRLPASSSPSVAIQGSVTTSEWVKLSSGIFRIGSGCMKGQYNYDEISQEQSGTFVAVPTMLGEPLELEWSLENWEGYYGYNSSPTLVSSAQLTGAAGTVELAGVATQYPLPLPGGTTVNQTVGLNYEVSPNVVKLQNVARQGDYSVALSVKATDPAGNVATMTVGVQFAGDVVLIGGGYQQKLADCARQAFLQASKVHTIPQVVPQWVAVNYPAPEQLVALIRYLVAVSTPEADTLLAEAKLAHGTSFYRALFSREAAEVTIGKMAAGDAVT